MSSDKSKSQKTNTVHLSKNQLLSCDKVELIKDSECKTAISNFEQGKNFTNSHQDLLWNICNGIRCYAYGLHPIYHVNYSIELRDAILKKYLTALGTHKLDVFFKRNDAIQQWEARLTISKVLVNIGYALRRELFWGYKNINKRLNDFPYEIKEALILISEISESNCKTKWPLLQAKIEEIKFLVKKSYLLSDGEYFVFGYK